MAVGVQVCHDLLEDCGRLGCFAEELHELEVGCGCDHRRQLRALLDLVRNRCEIIVGLHLPDKT